MVGIGRAVIKALKQRVVAFFVSGEGGTGQTGTSVGILVVAGMVQEHIGEFQMA